MRIAQVSTPHISTPPRGYGASELIAGLLSEEFARRGHEVTLFATADSPANVQHLMHFPEVRTIEDFEQRELAHVVRSLGYAESFDIVHNHCVSAGPAVAALVSRVPVLTSLHYLHPLLSIFPQHHYVAISEAQKRANPHLSIAQVVHNGLDAKTLSLRTSKDDYLLFLGRFHPNKGPHLAIEVARRVGMRLIIAAPSPPPDKVDYFETMIRPHLRGPIEWIGSVEGAEKDRLLGQAKCLLAPLCWDEPFGLVFVEAMLTGTPVVAVARGAAPEIIVHGRTGFLVASADDMPDAIARVGEIDPQVCRDHAIEHFSVQRMADGYLKVYADLLASPDYPMRSQRFKRAA